MDSIVTLKRALKRIKPVDIFIYGFSRRIRHQKQYYDIYSDLLIENQPYSYLIVERPYYGHLFPVPNNNIKYLDLAWAIGHLIQKITRLEDMRLEFVQRYFERILGKADPRIVIVTGLGGSIQIINAARKLNIPSLAIQQGATGNIHKADYIFVNGDKYKNYFLKNDLIHGVTNVEVTGQPFINNYENLPNEKNTICVVEGTDGVSNSKNLVTKLARNFKNYKITYLPHPVRRFKYKSDISGVPVLKKSNPYNLIAKSEYVIGEISTLLYEAQHLGSKVAVRGNNDYLQTGLFSYNNPGEINKFVRNYDAPNPGRDLYESNALSKQTNALSMILNKHEPIKN